MSPKSPKVSIGLPVYNGERYLGLAIKAILAQTCTDFELVISDNCSTDSTQEICERFAAQDERVRYYRNQKNVGAGPNFNRTYELSTGEFFKWMSHDDLIAPAFLEKCVAALDADPGAVLCHAQVELIDANGKITASYDPGISETMSERVPDRFAAVIIPIHMVTSFFGVIRRSALEGSPLHGKYPGADQTLLAVLALRGRFLLIEEPLFQNRAHAGRYSDGVAYQDRAEWFSADNKGKHVYAQWTQYREYHRQVRRHEMSSGDRARCYWHLFRWWFTGFNTPRMIADTLSTHFPGVFGVARKIKRKLFGLTDLGFDWDQWREKRDAKDNSSELARSESSLGTMVDGWNGDLSQILNRIAEVATGRTQLRVVRGGGGRIAIGLPLSRKAGRKLLDLYHPLRLNGRLFRYFIRMVLECHLDRLLLRPQSGGVARPQVEWLVHAAEMGLVGFVGGNPVHGPRCVLGGLTGDGDADRFVGKLGFDESRDAIIREAGLLDQLLGRFTGVPRKVSLDVGPDWALLRLPYLGFRSPGGMGDPVVIDILTQWLGSSICPLEKSDWAANLLCRAERDGVDPIWCGKMLRRRVRTALIHGDFTEWNLRVISTGPCAIDWEWGEEYGVGGVDLAHGLCQEALLIRRLEPEAAVRWMLGQTQTPAFSAYLRSCGWAGAERDWLILGLLHSHFNTRSDSREMLALLDIEMERV